MPVEYGAESPMPGREKEYEEFKAREQAGAEGVGGAPAYVPPPIDEERRNRSPGLSHNFYDVPMADFKRPYGFGRGGASPPPEPPAAAAAAPQAATPPPRGISPPLPVGYGAESPMPGREKEYEEYTAQGAGPGGPAYMPPPIDEERRNRSPGLSHNFYDVPMADFKRPYGFGRGGAPPPPEPPAAAPPSPESFGQAPTAADRADMTRGSLGTPASAAEVSPTGGEEQLSRAREMTPAARAVAKPVTDQASPAPSSNTLDPLPSPAPMTLTLTHFAPVSAAARRPARLADESSRARGQDSGRDGPFEGQ